MKIAGVFLLSAVLALSLFAEEFHSFTRYKVGYGIFTLGEATASLTIDDNGNYKTKVSAHAKGLAAKLSGNRVETYTSNGVVKEGRLVPHHFEKRSSYGNKKRHIEFFWDHENTQIVMEKEECEKKVCKYFSEALRDDKYVKDDILTLYHNIMADFNRTGAREINASAIGSNEPVVVLLPKGERLKIAKKTFDNKEGTYLVVILNQEIFTSSKGELYINADSDNTAVKAVLKKTMLFGDIWGEQIEKKISRPKAPTQNSTDIQPTPIVDLKKTVPTAPQNSTKTQPLPVVDLKETVPVVSQNSTKTKPEPVADLKETVPTAPQNNTKPQTTLNIICLDSNLCSVQNSTDTKPAQNKAR
ncbi:MAG: DUF3108 domain-containing protein [Campylobacteraceae bacterium]|jgi:hypothetical protein|nr:DUF3108 domain-containing protein [Campylobacteraceae bacterium]